MSSGASEIYARLLLPRKHGYPLWRPEPNELLPLEYQDKGIRIGDVGVITADGAFDFLFNVFLPKDHVINQWNRAVPEGFTPLPWDSRQVNRSSHLHRPGVSISSSGAQCYDLSLQASAQVPSSPISVGGGLRIKFQQSQGALLMLRSGASREDYQNLRQLGEYAALNAERWYDFANGTALGREAPNGSMYLITGFDKTCAWETAAFSHPSQETSVTIEFSSLGFGDGKLRMKQSSMVQNFLESRCSTEGSNTHNQSIFIRGFKIRLRQNPLKSHFLGAAKVTSINSMMPKDILYRGHISSPTASLPATGISEGAGSFPSHSIEATMLDDAHSVRSGSSDSSDENPNTQIYHPADVINSYLLEASDANVAITHDNDWCALLHKSEEEFPDDLELIRRFRENYEFDIGTDPFESVQRPTRTNIRIRSPLDACVIFYAVSLNLLRMVTRRLDTEERRLIAPGSCYVWEERDSNSEDSEVGIERWTDGIRWGPSSVKDEFLFYQEKDPDEADLELIGESSLMRGSPSPRPLLIKQTYTVFVETPSGQRKWHLIAYFDEESLPRLHTVDDFPRLASLSVPHGKFKSARSSTKGRLDHIFNPDQGADFPHIRDISHKLAVSNYWDPTVTESRALTTSSSEEK